MQPPAIDHDKFQALVRRKWTVSLSLTALMLAIYFGFVLVLAFGKGLLAARVGGLTLGIPLGLAVILAVWLLTGIYVAWANGSYDKAVVDIVSDMKE